MWNLGEPGARFPAAAPNEALLQNAVGEKYTFLFSGCSLERKTPAK